MAIAKKMAVKLIHYNSPEFHQAAQLRYQLFFAPLNLPWDLVQDEHQEGYFHAAIAIQDTVVAYGQLVPHNNGIYQICQMVVQTDYQRQNLGRKILIFLIDLARQEQAIALTLNARLTAVDFYQKLGFHTDGVPFPSSTTGVAHITMNQTL